MPSAIPAPVDHVAADPDELARSAADFCARHLADAIERRGEAHLVLTGGTVGIKTAVALPRAFIGAGVDTRVLHLWWGDERFVAASSEDRNDRQCARGLLERIGMPMKNIHRVAAAIGKRTVEEAAAQYGRDLFDAGFALGGEKQFDVTLLGMGPDGHVASLFPGRPELEIADALTAPVTGSPKPPPERVTLTFPALAASRHVVMLVAGTEKADAAARAHGESATTAEIPASNVGGSESTTWFLDTEAAAAL